MDSRKRLIITSVISIVLVSILLLGSTYSIFNSSDIDEEANVYKTGVLDISYTLSDKNVTLNISRPMSESQVAGITPYRITVTNSGSVPYKFNVILDPTTASNEIDHQYIMTKVGEIGAKNLGACTDNIIKEGVIVPGKQSVDIDVRVWVSDEVKNTEIGKSFFAKLKIDGIATYNSSEDIDNGILVANKAIALGDYVRMTPTKSSYTTDTSKTGYTSTQTINPQELNLWRVIKLNDDGTIEVISEYVSSVAVYFRSLAGYQNLVGYLNVLASQYENSTYTKGSRYFGYNGQTEYITDTSKFTTPAPWSCSTGGSCNPVESQGGGDTLYQKDYDLVNTALGTLVATTPSGSGVSYWVASRNYAYSSSDYYLFYARNVEVAGAGGNYGLIGYYGTNIRAFSYNYSLRPIVILKSGLKYSGDGTKESPLEIT